MRVRVVTPPAPIVPLERAKEQLRVFHTREDELIKAYIEAATAHLDGPDGWLGRALGIQELEATVDVFRDCMLLPYPPIVDVVSVKYLDSTASEMTVPPSEYELRGHLIGSAFGKRWPSVLAHPDAVRIRYRAGYAKVPASITAAILLMVGDLHKNRETTASGISVSAIPMSTTVENLLGPLRVYR